MSRRRYDHDDANAHKTAMKVRAAIARGLIDRDIDRSISRPDGQSVSLDGHPAAMRIEYWTPTPPCYIPDLGSIQGNLFVVASELRPASEPDKSSLNEKLVAELARSMPVELQSPAQTPANPFHFVSDMTGGVIRLVPRYYPCHPVMQPFSNEWTHPLGLMRWSSFRTSAQRRHLPSTC
jgi:hypothetical protein